MFGKERKKSDAACFIASVEWEVDRNRISAARTQSHTEVSGRWMRRQPVGKAEKGGLFGGGAACGGTAALPRGGDAQGSSAPSVGVCRPPGVGTRAGHGAGPAACSPHWLRSCRAASLCLCRTCLGISECRLEPSWAVLGPS